MDGYQVKTVIGLVLGLGCLGAMAFEVLMELIKTFPGRR